MTAFITNRHPYTLDLLKALGLEGAQVVSLTLDLSLNKIASATAVLRPDSDALKALAVKYELSGSEVSQTPVQIIMPAERADGRAPLAPPVV